MALLTGASSSSSNAQRDIIVEPKHKVFLSHSGTQKDFVEQLCVDLEGCDRYPFFDKCEDSLPIGEKFPDHIFEAIRQCHVGVVIMSDEFCTRSTWPMIELVAMVKEVRQGKSNLKIMPVFLYTSVKAFGDEVNRSRWVSLWHEWASKDERVNVEEWEGALQYLRPVSGLVYDGLGEVKFRRVIVDAICRMVPPETRFEDSYIQGRARLCKVIRDKIDVQRNELERGSEEELLREVLKRLTDTSRELLNGWNVDELLNRLRKIKESVFLALDNMAHSDASIKQVKSYLSACLRPGSIVIVTARSTGTLNCVREYIKESDILEMPELEIEGAKALFVNSCNSQLRDGVDEQVIQRCVQQCYFRKDDGGGSQHFHPLALDVLGRQLGCIDPRQWGAQLDKIDEDIFNQLGERNYPIFSILRKSFDALCLEDQLLLMDVALFLPDKVRIARNCNVFEWLCMVHRIPSMEDVMNGLERLKARSLLERLGDGIETRIGMHDLWRAFCIAETKSGELRGGRWVYEAKKCSEVFEPSASAFRENVTRMALVDCELIRKTDSAELAHFPNLTVLKFSREHYLAKEVVLDLSGLVHLKSLEVSGFRGEPPVLQGLPRGLVFLRYEGFGSKSRVLVKQIGCLKKLQFLHLIDYGGRKLPDMRNMISIHSAIFTRCYNVVKVTELSSKLTSLRVLHFAACERLRSCPGVGDLVGLEELNCRHCRRLNTLPNLVKLRNLRKLDISHCDLISGVPGLSDLVALEELSLEMWSDNRNLKILDMRNLRNILILRLHHRPLETVSGLDSLISLQELNANFQEVVEWPNLRQLTKLQKVAIIGWSLAGLRGLNNLAALHTLVISYCRGVDELPDLRSLISLQRLKITDCEFKDVSGLSNSRALEYLMIAGCNKSERVPDLHTLARLKSLDISGCNALRRWDCTSGQVESSSWRLDSTSVQFGLPDSEWLSDLRTLRFSDCQILDDLAVLRGFSQLERLECSEVALIEFPDLSSFPRLKILEMKRCPSFTRLETREPMGALSELVFEKCSSLAALPDLCNFPVLLKLEVWECDGITTLSSSGPLPALRELSLRDVGVEAVPDLRMFPALKELELYQCSRLMMLSCSGLLTALTAIFMAHDSTFDTRPCNALRTLPDLGMNFPGLETVWLNGCSELTTLSCSVPLPSLRDLSVEDCSGLEALPDLGMFPALKALKLKVCRGLLTLGSSVPLTVMKLLDSCPEDLRDQLRGLCPHLDEIVEETWRSRLLGCFRG